MAASARTMVAPIARLIIPSASLPNREDLS
jgi:hypothetical protein